MFQFRTLSRVVYFIALAAAITTRADGDFQGATHMVPFDEGTKSYNNSQPNDPITALQERLNRNEIHLKTNSSHGYLDAVLAELKIPVSSQVLVFSKTSFQRERISPDTPRALFFNDDVYVGFIPGSPMMEVSTADPKLGGVFYTLDQSSQGTPKFKRTDQCLECHAAAKSMGVPGHILRSFATDESGVVDLSSGISEVNHRTPFTDRWGGWYVTGTHGEMTHHGNLIGSKAFADQEKHPNQFGNLTDLSKFFDVSRYPQPSSDIVALMVLEHQAHMHNFLTRLHYEADIQLARYGHINYVTNIADAFLKYMLFAEEVSLKAPVKGNSTFSTDFQKLGPIDSKGRSLRDFDLQKRLFKYPCSYLIYSKAFDALPDPMKQYLYQRLWDILSGKDQTDAFGDVPKSTRRAILEILAETKKDLPPYWKL
jgi:hypothetical protein